mgnify:CR=1 FL=1
MLLSCTMPTNVITLRFEKKTNCYLLSMVRFIQGIRDTRRLILRQRQTIDTITILQNGTRTLEKINGNVQIFKNSSDISR